MVAQTLKEAYGACQKDRPLDSGDPYYQDFSAGRGDRSTAKLLRRFQFLESGEFARVVFASHRGAGKTTELNRLQAQLEPSYHRLYLEANAVLDEHQLEMEDLLLVLAQAIHDNFKERGTPLPEKLLEKVFGWFQEIIQTTVVGKTFAAEVGAGVEAETLPLWAKIFGRLSALVKVESDSRKEVRSVLRNYPGALLDAVNQLLDAAGEILKKEGKRLLLVIDNLDRYSPQVADDLLVKNGDRIRNLHTSFILTPPIALIYRPASESLTAYYGSDIMNTVRLRRKDQEYHAFDGPGFGLMEGALAKRMNLDLLLPDPQARRRLIAASGGAIRDLLGLVREAILLAEGDVLDLAAVNAAVDRSKVVYRDMINTNGWMPTLKRIAREHQVNEDPHCMDVLYHRLVLKYNGEGWYDIHPLVAELPEFLTP